MNQRNLRMAPAAFASLDTWRGRHDIVTQFENGTNDTLEKGRIQRCSHTSVSKLQ